MKKSLSGLVLARIEADTWNNHSAAFFLLYKICRLLRRSKLKVCWLFAMYHSNFRTFAMLAELSLEYVIFNLVFTNLPELQNIPDNCRNSVYAEKCSRKKLEKSRNDFKNLLISRQALLLMYADKSPHLEELRDMAMVSLNDFCHAPWAVE